MNILAWFISLIAFTHAIPTRDIPPLIITNGVEVIPHSYPYQVKILIDNGDWTKQTYCGGILISSRYVLTAARCVEGHEKFEIVLGAHNATKKEPTQIRVKGIDSNVHPGFDQSTHLNDIALIELQNKVFSGEAIDFAKLPKNNDKVSLRGRFATITGWGQKSRTGGSDVLLETVINIIDNTNCSSYYDYITDDEICLSGTYDRVACGGDAGGPVIIDNIVYGIVSFGSPYCLDYYPVVATRITPYLSWIEDNSDCDFQ